MNIVSFSETLDQHKIEKLTQADIAVAQINALLPIHLKINKRYTGQMVKSTFDALSLEDQTNIKYAKLFDSYTNIEIVAEIRYLNEEQSIKKAYAPIPVKQILSIGAYIYF